MGFRSLITTLAWSLLASVAFAQTPPTPAVHIGWYVQITPQPGSGKSCLVGPWPWYAAAADWDGSALYAHPFACHTTGNPADCGIIGNGLAYPAQYPYVSKGAQRVPASAQIPSSGPIQLPTATNPHEYGWYRLYYGNDGSCVAFPKAQNAKYRALVLSGQGVFPRYEDVRCPGWPFFMVGTGVGQNDDVCN